MIESNLNGVVRQVKAKVELYNNSTLVDTFTSDDKLINFTIERVGDNTKFFGFLVIQKLHIRLIDVMRELDITTDNSFKIYINDENYFPTFHITEVNRNENTNELSITAYDKLYFAKMHTVSEMDVVAPYNLQQFTKSAIKLLNITSNIWDGNTEEDYCYLAEYTAGANFDGTETLQEALTAVAEASHTIAFLNNQDYLHFKRLDISGIGNAKYTITRNDYYTLDDKTNRRLTNIVATSELGDNVSVNTGLSGTTQYIRNNPFWELREDIAKLLDCAIGDVGNITIARFNMNWRANYICDLVDKIKIETKDNNTITTFLLDDVITYDGGLKATTQWELQENDTETAANPNNIGEALKMTYARVDKVNKEIDLLASEVSANAESISSLQINTDSISASVKTIEDNTNNIVEGLNSEIGKLTQELNTKISAEELSILVSSELDNGVNKITTSTGFTFNEEGLSINKNNSEMKTEITEDGMKVYKNEEEVLTANNEGVNAVNLHATTYLIIGSNSRFEDYLNNRTGCFWIGG